MKRVILFCAGVLPALCVASAQEYPTSPPPTAYQQPYPAEPGYQQPLPPAQQPATRLSAQDLSNLVAPIALYPDLLLSEVLAASTYPLELVQAEQWMQGNPNLHGQDLVNAAKQQPWDPSVQALVAFPDVMSLLTRDIQWTTNLGDAFLAQQGDVMDAIQQLRASARANGRLGDTPQQRVVVDQQNGQNAIEIQPADPQVVYPPVYNPAYVWGPPVYGAYPPLVYPAPTYGIGFAVGTFLGGLFTGLLSFGGWGWGLSWFSHGLFLNGLFFSHFGFHGYGGYGFRGGPGYAAHAMWVHDPGHRLGVPYGNRFAGARYNSGTRYNYGGRSFNEGRSYSAGRSGNFGSSYQGGGRQMEAYRGLTNRESRGSSFGGSRGYAGGYGSSGSREGFASRGGLNARSYSTPHYSAPSASRGIGGGGHSSSHEHFGGGGGHSGGAHFGGGHSSGGHGHSGGGHSGGGHSHGGHHK